MTVAFKIVKFYYLNFTKMRVKELLIKNAEALAEETAFVFGERRVSFLELRQISFRLANYLCSQYKQSPKVALFLSNIPEIIFSYLGVFSIGGVLVPLDFMLTQQELINFLQHSEVEVLITQPKKDSDLKEIKKSCPALKEIILCQGKDTQFSLWEEILERSPAKEPPVNLDEEALSSIFYTSGTTGHPKGVMLSYNNLDYPVETIHHFLGITNKDIFLTGGVPFSHLGGLDYLLLMLRFGAKMILMERFHPLEFLKHIERHRVTIFCIVPSMYVAILSLKEYGRFELSSLRYAVVFGAPSSAALLERFHQLCPQAILLNGWGMTETSAPNTFSPPDERKINSIGRFGFQMEAKIVDEVGNEVSCGERGELWVKGKAVMLGYYKESELTKEVFTEDGWLKTGDIAYKDNEGLFYIVGRKKDIIKVSGELVFAGEVEEKIQLYPKVKEVAVIGVRDALRGEVPKAFIVPQENEQIDLGELKEFLRKQLAHFKMPQGFVFLKELPKNRVGKIDKQALREVS